VRLAGEDLHVARGGKAILRGVHVGVEDGEIVAVVGPSGAGKSTLFRALVGELPVASGRVLLGDDDVTDWPLWARARAGIGYVPQSPSVLLGLSVRANLVAYRRIAGEPDGDPARDAARFDLASRLDVLAGDLSAGERRRLEIARALVRTPRVVVFDEPFAGVDPIGASRIADILRELAKSGVAIVLADHHVAEALAVATRAVLLLDGAIAAAGDPTTFQDEPLVRGRYLGTWSRPPPA
jgi:lipopolysaccharide export system ATP-binding protein